MAFKKTFFNPQWLDGTLHPEFSTWISEVKANKCQAYCKVCYKTIVLSNMGRQALVSHAKTPSHVKNAKVTSAQHSVSVLFNASKTTETPAQVGENIAITKSSTDNNPLPVSQNQEAKGSVAFYLLKDEVTKAEILWTLQVVAKGMSFYSCANVGQVFRLMFPDSSIAKQFTLGKDKVAYILTYGLAPYFGEQLLKRVKECNNFVICFDESMNKVVQRGQMDLIIRYWDGDRLKVVSRYLKSVFLNRATAEDLLDKFTEGIYPLAMKNLLQVSMDGPNVNLSFLKKLEAKLRSVNEESGDEQKLLYLGTCSLHTVHGSMKTGLQAADWNMHAVLRSMYYLFHDSPARRAIYKTLTGSDLFPLKFCSVRWVENCKCFDRALAVWDHVMLYIKKADLTSSKSALVLKEATTDPLMKCKLAFSKSISLKCEPFLRRFQSSKPLAPFLYEELHQLVRSLMTDCVKQDKLTDAKTAVQLSTIDLTCTENLLPRDKVEVGFSARRFLSQAKTSEREKALFLYQCRKLLTTMVEKLLEKTPLKQKLVRGLSALDPSIITHQPKVGKSRMSDVLEILFNANRISDNQADKAKAQYSMLCEESKTKMKDKFEEYLSKRNDTVGLDTFYASILSTELNYSALWKVVKVCLIMSHGNATVESGFSINKSLLIENLHEKTIVAQRIVYDYIQDVGGIEEVSVDKKLLDSVRSARKRYSDELEKQKSLIRQEESVKAKKKLLEKQIKDLETKKSMIRKEALLDETTIDIELKHLEKKRKCL